MIKIKNTIEILKEDILLRYLEGDNVICVTLEGRLYLGCIESIGMFEGKEAIYLNTSNINNPYKYSSAIMFVDEIDYIIEDNDTNREIILKLLWEQNKEEFVNNFAELGFDIDRIESLYDKVKNIAHINSVAMADLVKCLVYSVENDANFKEYLLGIE